MYEGMPRQAVIESVSNLSVADRVHDGRRVVGNKPVVVTSYMSYQLQELKNDLRLISGSADGMLSA